MKEVKEMVSETCKNVLLHFAAARQVDQDKIIVRIDLKHIKEKPVFALFNQSDFIASCELREIIQAGGGKGLNMILGSYIRNIIRDIFSQTMKQLESTDSKELFLLLYLEKKADQAEPVMAVYYKKEFIWSVQIAEAIASDPKQGLL